MKLKTLVYVSLTAIMTAFATAAYSQTFSVIHTFTPGSGVRPTAGVTIRAGVLYGTTNCTQDPDNCGNGIVYQLTHVGANWFYTPISLLSAGGSNPDARVVFGPDNHLYGTTTFGGDPPGGGIVFNLTPPLSICKTAACAWSEKVLHQFHGPPDGLFPGNGDLVWDAMGSMYGVTQAGGASSFGTVFQMTKSGNNWTESPIYSSTGLDGVHPYSGVIFDGNDNLFATTAAGGLYNSGTVFELTYMEGVGWTQTVLYNFQNLSDGQAPLGGLITDSAGNLYGSTSDGGSAGGGTVFELSPVGDTWVFATLYSFTGKRTCGPVAALTMDASGNLYGTTVCDGSYGLGSVFKLTNTQIGWQYNSLHDFTRGSDGAAPASNVTIDTDGSLYGTASQGGSFAGECATYLGCGTVWMIKP